jgi:micrococcal nuclease
MITPEYTYKATVVRWVDGDTVYLEVDLGFRLTMLADYRLYGINTPERGQVNYKEATAFAEQLAPVGAIIVAKTYKDPEKYGRWLAELYVDDTNINQALIASGLAVPYFGGTK